MASWRRRAGTALRRGIATTYRAMRAPASESDPSPLTAPAPERTGPTPPTTGAGLPGRTLGVTGPEGDRADAPREPAPSLYLDGGSVWRAAWIVVAVVALATAGSTFLTDGAPVLFNIVMGFFASIALEPLVGRLARVVPRWLATAVTMVLVAVLVVAFVLAFGGLLRDQAIQLVTSAPGLVLAAVGWVNETFHTDFDAAALLSQVRLDTANVATLVTTLAGGIVGLASSVASYAFSAFSFLFFTFYLSADAPRLRVWIAQLFPPRQQVVVLTLWQLTLTKIGGYVAARLVLAAICSAFTSVFLYFIDMPYWLPLGIWTGVVAQFVPTIGTYLAISLPVVVGLLGPEPSKGVAALVFAIVYQQVENLTWEPRISARAVSVHPAVSFAAAILGGTLFGVGGALVGVPVSATLIAVFDIYKRRYDLSGTAEREAIQAVRPELRLPWRHHGPGPRPAARAADPALEAEQEAKDKGITPDGPYRG